MAKHSLQGGLTDDMISKSKIDALEMVINGLKKATNEQSIVHSKEPDDKGEDDGAESGDDEFDHAGEV